MQNFTDIDDKLIKKANEEGITVPEVAERYIAEYKTDAAGLGVRPANIHPGPPRWCRTSSASSRH